MSDNMSHAMRVMSDQDREIVHLRGLVQTAVNCAMDSVNERDRLRAAVTALASLVQRDRVELYQAHRLPSGMVDDDEGKRGLAEYDAALKLADEAMGNEERAA